MKTDLRGLLTEEEEEETKISSIGIQMRKNGRYAAVITDRIRHKRVWLGTFDTVEEASQAYFAKKTEFEKLNLGNKEDRLKKNCDPHKTTQFVGVQKRKDSGKYISEIRNPISKKRIWLGTFDTAEEASRAYQSKNLQFQKLADSKRQCSSNKQTHSTLESAGGSEIDVTISNLSNGRTEQRIDSHEIGTDEEGFCVYPSKKKQAPKVFNSGLMANVYGEESSNTTTHCDPKVKRSLVGIRRRKSGRYAARITDPIRHKRVWLGTFDTFEEASWAYFSKKSEFEKLSELGNKENKPQKMSDQIQHDTTRCDPKVKRNLIGITRRKSGRYAATITDRIRHKRVWLGTFDTVEEASRAYFSKKSEFEKLSQQGEKKNSDQIQQPVAASLSMANDQTLDTPNLGSRRKKRNDSHKTTRFFRVHKRKDSGKYTSEIRNPISKKRIWLGTFDTAEEASRAYQSKNLEFQKLVEEKQQQWVGQEDDEELWMGQWVQLPGDDDRAIMFSLKLGLPIIDNYGYLLGEFSSLDDLSIC
ncbi:hypothetical protein KY290_034858 [Solanum tuberosum]|uniref:AP2/ERF domain-containing protein n=2 Tax=Solanum tuberosum TaxID=4113 RepID=A0ABQ7U7Z1_SOLTU|nr:hypothetical protein KY290_034858 [Solanum tuberosum]